MIGLALQAFSFKYEVLLLKEHGLGAVIFGRSLLLSVLVNCVMGFESVSFKEKKERVMIKIMLLTGMVFFTVNNFLGFEIAEAVMSIAFVLSVALFWEQLMKFGKPRFIGVFVIVAVSILSFIITWMNLSGKILALSPLLWMVAFCYALTIFTLKKEQV